MPVTPPPPVIRTVHVKHNPTSGSVAVRTVFDAEQFPNMVWLIATTGTGAQNASNADVAGWADLFTPPEPSGSDGSGSA